MQNITASQAIRFNEVGILRSILNRQYYNAKHPTMSEQAVENLKQQIIYSNKTFMLAAFNKYEIKIP